MSDSSETAVAGKHVLVTGGAGFIGSHLVDALLARGAGRVTIVDSMRFANAHHAEHARERVTVIRHALGVDPFERLAPALRDVDLLFHLAAEKHNQSLATPDQLLASNVTGLGASAPGQLYDPVTVPPNLPSSP